MGMNIRCVKGNEIFIFCHGASSSGMSWRLVIPYLNDLGHKTVAIDMPGHGNDMTAEIGDMTMDNYAQRVVDVIDRQERPVILVGHSMGGGVITAAGQLCPERIKKLVYLTAHMPLPGNSMNGLSDSRQPIDWYQGSLDGRTVPSTFMQIYRGEGTAPVPHTAMVDRESGEHYQSRESLDVLMKPIGHTPERWGRIPRYYIETMADADLWTSLQQMYIDYWGCEAVYRIEADHGAPSAEPEQVAFILHNIACSSRYEVMK